MYVRKQPRDEIQERHASVSATRNPQQRTDVHRVITPCWDSISWLGTRVSVKLYKRL